MHKLDKNGKQFPFLFAVYEVDMKKIVVLDGSAVVQDDLNFDLLKSLGSCDYYDHTPKDLVAQRIGNAEIVLTNKVIIDKDIIDSCPSVKFISVLATGYNVVDCAYAREKCIVVSNVPAYSTDSVAQHTFALILELCSHVGQHDSAVKQGQWSKSKDFCFCLTSIIELKNKTIGIIGYGSIGKAVQKIAEAFGMKVLFNTRSMVSGSVTLEKLLIESDFITLHCPLTDANKGMINSKSISLMKPTAFVINTARGGLIEEKDLADALNSDKIAGFGADVLSVEPPKESNPLLHAKNTIITPHIAWASRDARSRLVSITRDNIKNYLDGTPINVVN